jgi:hypothetical protein
MPGETSTHQSDLGKELCPNHYKKDNTDSVNICSLPSYSLQPSLSCHKGHCGWRNSGSLTLAPGLELSFHGDPAVPLIHQLTLKVTQAWWLPENQEF